MSSSFPLLLTHRRAATAKMASKDLAEIGTRIRARLDPSNNTDVERPIGDLR
jgi:hypothetical protein